MSAIVISVEYFFSIYYTYFPPGKSSRCNYCSKQDRPFSQWDQFGHGWDCELAAECKKRWGF